ncbi:hypothetical protein GCM10027610_046860 [Dactylosporangium cerinum]
MAGADDQVGVGEPPDRLGDRRLGQAGQGAQLGARELAVVEQVPERGRLVERLEQLGGSAQRHLLSPPTNRQID